MLTRNNVHVLKLDPTCPKTGPSLEETVGMVSKTRLTGKNLSKFGGSNEPIITHTLLVPQLKTKLRI